LLCFATTQRAPGGRPTAHISEKRRRTTPLLPVFNKESLIVPCVGEIGRPAKGVGRPRRAVVVDDGNTGRTFALLKELRGMASALRVLRVAASRGHTAASAAGLRLAGARSPSHSLPAGRTAWRTVHACVVFWCLSLAGGAMLFFCATRRKHGPVVGPGQTAGCVVFVRNRMRLCAGQVSAAASLCE
jgi:hypothetical protein